MIRLDSVKNLSVEELVDYIYLNKIDIIELLKKVKASDLTELDRKELIKKINSAKDRMNKSMDLQQFILYFIFPFGITSIFNENINSDYNQFVKFNYRKKIRQYFWVSILGFLFYICLAVSVVIFYRFSH
jgi:hypothetical protein